MLFGKCKNVIAVLSAMQRRVCIYSPAQRVAHCDCKFVRSPQDLAGVLGQVEHGNGCPELRTAVALLGQLTDYEYQQLALRADRATVLASGAVEHIQRCQERNGHRRCQKVKGHDGKHEFGKVK